MDTNKSNNFYKNLEWATSKENSVHATLNNLQKHRYGIENNLFGKKGALSYVARSVIQLYPSGEIKEKWGSVTEAANSIGVNTCCISDCCNGNQKTSGGFIWKYS